MKHAFLLALLVLVAGPAPASRAAEGGGIGARGGGSIQILNGRWELLEVAAGRGVEGETYRLTPETRDLIVQIRSLFETYARISVPRYWEEVLGPRADFRVVDRLPCEHRDSRERLTYGCTIEGVSYLHAKTFRTVLDPKQQVLALLHERAHAFDPSPDAHDWIRPFIRGLATLVDVRLEQQNGVFRELRPFELRALDGLLNDARIRTALGATPPYSGALSIANAHVFGGGVLRLPAGMDSRRVVLDRVFIALDSEIDLSVCRWSPAQLKQATLRFERSRLAASFLSCATLVDASLLRSSAEFRLFAEDGKSATPGAFRAGTELTDATLQLRGRSADFAGAAIRDSFLVNDRPDMELDFRGATVEKSRIDYTQDHEDFFESSTRPVLSEPPRVVACELITGGRKAPGTDCDGSGRRGLRAEGFGLRAERAAQSIDEAPVRKSGPRTFTLGR